MGTRLALLNALVEARAPPPEEEEEEDSPPAPASAVSGARWESQTEFVARRREGREMSMLCALAGLPSELGGALLAAGCSSGYMQTASLDAIERVVCGIEAWPGNEQLLQLLRAVRAHLHRAPVAIDGTVDRELNGEGGTVATALSTLAAASDEEAPPPRLLSLARAVRGGERA